MTVLVFFSISLQREALPAKFCKPKRNQDFEMMISFFLFLLAVVVFYIGNQIVHALRKIGLELEILRGKREKDD